VSREIRKNSADFTEDFALERLARPPQLPSKGAGECIFLHSLAYLVVDRLNCVTLDCWPSQKTIADQFGWSTKTVHRVAAGLKKRAHLRIIRKSNGSYRYAPAFLSGDEDKSVDSTRQACPFVPDKSVDESFLGIPINKSSPSAYESAARKPASNYNRRQRGSYEAELTKLLGNGGFGILERLNQRCFALVTRSKSDSVPGLVSTPFMKAPRSLHVQAKRCSLRSRQSDRAGDNAPHVRPERMPGRQSTFQRSSFRGRTLCSGIRLRPF
jgi:hypothetical protein